jgi:uncharacterized lipoprotein YmbA
MNKTRRFNAVFVRVPLLLGLAVGLASCSRAPVADLYLLDLPAVTEPAGADKGPVVGINPLEFPRYLDRPQIVTRDGLNQLHASEIHVWAEPLQHGASRVLLIGLGRALESNRVYLVPQRNSLALDWRVDIEVSRLDGAIHSAVNLTARWSLYGGDESDPRLTRISIIEQPLETAHYRAFVAAQSIALERLAGEIAAAIRTLE